MTNKKEYFMKVFKKSYVLTFLVLVTLCLFAGLYRPATSYCTHAANTDFGYEKFPTQESPVLELIKKFEY